MKLISSVLQNLQPICFKKNHKNHFSKLIRIEKKHTLSFPLKNERIRIMESLTNLSGMTSPKSLFRVLLKTQKISSKVASLQTFVFFLKISWRN